MVLEIIIGITIFLFLLARTRLKGVDTRKINLPSNRSSLIIVFTSNISLGQLKAPRSVIYLTEAIFYI